MSAITNTRWTVIDYCREEVTRQGHDTTLLDGIERVAWMLSAWSYALEASRHDAFPSITQIKRIGRLVEQGKNAGGFRRVGVRVGMRVCPPASEVEPRLKRLYEVAGGMTPLEFYRELLEIHPFVDGNGRTGKVVLNWLNGTLLDPIFPPADFWGDPIRNP